jgi:nitric oxide reductase large subunit
MSREIRNGYLSTVIILVAQFLLGMATNLFITVPLNHPGANPPEYFSGVAQSVTWAILHGPIWLVLHAALGLILLVFGLRLLVPAIRSRHRPTIITAVIGAVAILGAGLNGGSYLKYHEDFSSMIMASFFAIAVTAYVFGLWALRPQQESPAPAAR